MKRDKSDYAIAREPYKLLFPTAKMHHGHPLTRGGPDCEFNLFPWNARSHAAWHDLFSVMTVQEIFPILREAYRLIFDTDDEELIRTWCLPYLFEVKKDIREDMTRPRHVSDLRNAWFTCFGSCELLAARRVVKYMMLFMIFGRYADGREEIYEDSFLRKLLARVPKTGERAWAFERCFGCTPEHVRLSDVKRVIERVRTNAQSLVVR